MSQRLVDEFVAAVLDGRAIRVTSPHWVTGTHPNLVEGEILALVDAAG